MYLDELSKRFRNFAEIECRDSSPLYEHLSLQLAEDIELLELSSHARPGQPVPNLLFGAVHLLLFEQQSHPLKDFYMSIVNHPKSPQDAFPYFRDFCEENTDEIISLLQSKLVQTNEVRRCAYLYPAFSFIYEKTKMPLALIEIGTSGGLQLLWDQYQYSYNENNERFGNLESQLLISSTIRGAHQPNIIETSPPVTSRTGFDLHINNKADHPWLKALIWPEHEERRALFDQAVKSLRDIDLELIEGDGVELFVQKVEEIPESQLVCIFHTHVANQIPEESKQELMRKIKELGLKRNVCHLYNNMWDRKLHLDFYLDGEEYQHTVGETEGHGKWFEWNIPS
ncbi:DUF2332 domain-containing protein [Rossellomorea aquimaris]|uniref:DUF2332 domain-containing protein n=1 Tax=Rossellomorea aquimaris TaxID=189382 RepID=UPI0007D08051|nr:DUF2332 domain-containing protein [Rossellomorea aquimaris]